MSPHLYVHMVLHTHLSKMSLNEYHELGKEVGCGAQRLIQIALAPTSRALSPSEAITSFKLRTRRRLHVSTATSINDIAEQLIDCSVFGQSLAVLLVSHPAVAINPNQVG